MGRIGTVVDKLLKHKAVDNVANYSLVNLLLQIEVGNVDLTNSSLKVGIGNFPLLAGAVDAIFICPIQHCLESFSKGIDLLRHQMAKNHFQDSRCEVCRKSFANDFTVKRHIKAVHENIKFQCSECGNMYGRLYLYKDHRRKEHGIID